MSNPHYALAQDSLERKHEWRERDRTYFVALAQTEATLALAYETRTANLLAAYALEYQNPTEIRHRIQTRLGLGDTK